ncbi:MAG: hypothetical protein H7249_14070 [Chitinophagaceae bacterium]|nr:hypothetical protein [Oligoflexus sp.]
MKHIAHRHVFLVASLFLLTNCQGKKNTEEKTAAPEKPTANPGGSNPSSTVPRDTINPSSGVGGSTTHTAASAGGSVSAATSVSNPPAGPSYFVPDADTPSSLFNWVGILGTGQSLSVGAASGATLTTGASYNNLKLFDSSGSYNTQGNTLSVVPLTEPLKPTSNLYVYPTNIGGETFHGMMATTMTGLSRTIANRDLISAHTAAGYSGADMNSIKKGGSLTSYASGIFEANAFAALATAAGKSFGYGGVVLTHGEADWATPGYGATMQQMYIDYNADLKAITGQTKNIPLFISQQHTFPNTASGYYPHIASTQAQWVASMDYADKIILVGPKYQYSYSDSVHLTASGYEDFGKKLGEVYYRVTEKKEAWKPLQPNVAKQVSANIIRVTFDVPVPPLQFNSTMTPPHQSVNAEWANGKGFEVLDYSGNRVTITSVTIVGSSVDIVVVGGASSVRTVQYATTQDRANGYTGGAVDGRFGLLTDSDIMVNQVNFCVAFIKRVERDNSGLTQLSGRATDISWGNGVLWTIGDVWTYPNALDMNMQYRDGTGVLQTLADSAAERVDISKAGYIFASVGTGTVVFRPALGSGNWIFWAQAIPNSEIIYDLSLGGPAHGSESLWVTSTTGAVYFWNGSTWVTITGTTLYELDVDNSGAAWGFDSTGRLKKWNGAGWTDKGVDGVSISIADDGTVYIIGKSDRNIYHLASGGTIWIQDTTGGGFDRVAAGASGVVYMTNGEKVYQK